MRSSALAFRFSTSLLLGCVISLCACHKAEAAQALAEKVAAMPCFSSGVERNLEDVETRLEALSRDQSEAADKALVMLMGYYFGEHNGEELESEVIRRGKRMKPLLVQEQQSPAVLSTCARRLELERVKDRASSAIEAINRRSIRKMKL